MEMKESSIDFEKMQLISSGPLTKTYRAFDVQKTKEVIVKEFTNTDYFDVIRKSRNEILHLSCEHLPKIYDIINSTKCHCVTMECIKGVPLSKYMYEYQYNIATVVKIGLDICDAILCLKNNNMIHLDIKPANIIYNPYNEKATLIDLDFAFISNKITNMKFKYIGTINYSSPEQITNNTTSVSSDIYSLGVVLYELVEGKLPYSNKKQRILRITNADVDFLFDEIIKQMLSYEPDQRITPECAIKEFEEILFRIKKDEIANLFLKIN